MIDVFIFTQAQLFVFSKALVSFESKLSLLTSSAPSPSRRTPIEHSLSQGREAPSHPPSESSGLRVTRRSWRSAERDSLSKSTVDRSSLVRELQVHSNPPVRQPLLSTRPLLSTPLPPHHGERGCHVCHGHQVVRGHAAPGGECFMSFVERSR